MQHELQIFAHDTNQGEPIWFLGALSIIKISAAQSGGQLSMIEDRMPAGRATPYHVHHREDEAFYLLEGTATFYSGNQKFQASAGATVFLPREIPHGFRTDTPARFLVIATPAGFDRFVAEAGQPAQAWTLPEPSVPDVARLTEIAARYGIDILGPLPD